jgi:predicted  nucleic acid-binding Zn-ribbon protein
MNAIAEETRQLVRLQAIDLERTRLTAALRGLPNDIAIAENQLKAARKRVTDAEAGLKREELTRSRLELEADSLRTKAARHRKQMDDARTSEQAAALEHEIGFAESTIQKLEDDQLASMEASELLEAERAEAGVLAGKLEETFGRIKARVGEQDLEFREELARLNTERAALRPTIDTATLAHFDRISGSRGTGLARAEGQQCSGCRMGIRPQVWNQLREGVVTHCESCNRILYYDPQMSPETPAKPAQSVRGGDANLGGSSIRRQAGS